MSRINYREDQLPIIQYEGGKMAVPAVPGAGKTFIVTNLVAKLLEEKRQGKGKILILTYMNSAVNNFKVRIKKILEEKNIDDKNSYEVMTIHSLAVKIIKEKPEIVMLNEDFNIADDLQKTMILGDCINNFKLNGGEKAFRFFVKEQKDPIWADRQLEAWDKGFYDLVQNTISELKYKDITPQKLNKYMKENRRGILKIILPIYTEYEKKLKANGLLDYDDMLILAHKALSIDEDLKRKYQNKYQYVFEDECQDSNEIQGKIIGIICEEHNNLVRVGDINQSITGTFSSSDPKFFKNFIESSDRCYRMDMSNRSSKDVINLANELVRYVTQNLQPECKDALEDMDIKTVPKNRGYKENPQPDKYQISYKYYETFDKEIENTVKFVRNINKKYPDKSIGILVPYNDHVNLVAKELIKEDLEFEELGPNSLRKRRVIDNIALIIDFILNCDDKEKLIEVLDKVYMKTDNKEGKKDFIQLLREDHLTVENLLYDDECSKNIIIDTDSDLYQSFLFGIKKLENIIEYPLTRIDKLILFIGDSMTIEKEEIAIVDYLAFYVKYLVAENNNINLQQIYNLLIDRKNRVFSYIIEVVSEINGYEPLPGSITVCNYHKSKGLEWDCVFLLGMTEFNFPDNIYQKFQCDKWYLKEKYKNPEANIKAEIDFILKGEVNKNYSKEIKESLIKEKIRLLYVGITRAKEMLILSASAKNSATDKKKQNPSMYLNILKSIIDKKGE
ncbi:MAG: ATP-dependent helicase [Terrisporobacter othiniensis]|uniref:ATP-dependent helicase n=1 Tax=Terrisporobacter petrolearius TaxID=1460447 RepID=UPI0022E1E5EB|nr:ATP-dependent helicase [Terrisporobacter petrolearius]MDU4860241.1 ATP-dependent helicase [Terrisporobacter othiniensis]MDU6996382.1 ATP-dependent helicase [Terrisporobacter othiniensis]